MLFRKRPKLLDQVMQRMRKNQRNLPMLGIVNKQNLTAAQKPHLLAELTRPVRGYAIKQHRTTSNKAGQFEVSVTYIVFSYLSEECEQFVDAEKIGSILIRGMTRPMNPIMKRWLGIQLILNSLLITISMRFRMLAATPTKLIIKKEHLMQMEPVQPVLRDPVLSHHY